MSSTPLLFTASGPVATPPAVLQQNLLTAVAQESPGYTAALPGILIEDMSSTAVGALAVIDQARVDAVNSVTPYAANPYILAQLGLQFGVPIGQLSSGSVYEVFSGPAGTVIAPGFVVGDGTNQYQTSDGGVIGSAGTSAPIFFVATNASVFPIPANTVTTPVTTIPGIAVTCTNPTAGTAATGSETVESYRSRLLQAYQSWGQGVASTLKTLLQAISGVSPRLISVIPNGSNFEILCGGGDPYQVAAAIYQGVSNPGMLVGSATTARNITVSLYDAPNTYSIVYVNPPQQTVTVAVTWNTTLANFTASSAVNQYIIGAVQSYINAIVVGQPINLLVLNEVIQQAIASVLAPINLTTLTYVVTINGTTVGPAAGTSVIPSDPESYFYIAPTGVTSTQG